MAPHNLLKLDLVAEAGFIYPYGDLTPVIEVRGYVQLRGELVEFAGECDWHDDHPLPRARRGFEKSITHSDYREFSIDPLAARARLRARGWSLRRIYDAERESLAF